MNSPFHTYTYFCNPTTRSAIIIALLLLIISPCFSICFSIQQQYPSSDFPRELLMEVKQKLGSTPPSCHNKCNGCHPCMAVQVPTLRTQSVQLVQRSSYSNYKPLGWKCRCQDHFYNP